MEDYTILCKNYNNFVLDCFTSSWFNTLPAYEDADDAYAGAWWDDPRFEVLREFFDNNGFPYELWNEGKFSDTFPYLLEYRYGIPALEFENKTLSEIVEYLYSDWGEDLNVPVLRGAEWQGGSLPDDYNYYINRSDPDELYYFHSDHLGSGSVITNGNSGDVYQTLAYAPFGELLINLRNGLYDEPYKFTGYERDEETGFDYAHARYYWSDLGIFTSVDMLAEKKPWLTGYNYCSNNLVNRIDPTGLTDFTLDKETGDVKQYGEKNDQQDRILKTNKKGEVQTKRNGEVKVAVDGIEPGILKDGQNLSSKDNIIEVGGDGQPSEEGVETFVLKLSEYVSKEIAGAYFSKDGSKSTHITIGGYKDNTYKKSKRTGFNLGMREGLTPTGTFHTHPTDPSISDLDRKNPSEKDKRTRDSDLKFNPNLRFYILTAPSRYGDKYPQKIEYTNHK